MSIDTLKSFTRSVPIAIAALLVHIGSSAGSTPHYDYQQQVRDWLSGSVTLRPVVRAEMRSNDVSRAEVDTQTSVREFLSGSAISLVAHVEWNKDDAGDSSDVVQKPQRSQAEKDIQAATRRLLQGERVSRGDRGDSAAGAGP